MPVGMHRPQASRWKNVWPFLVILVIVPLLAWGASILLMNRQSGTVVSTSQSAPAARSAQSAQSSQSARSEQTAQSEQSARSLEEPEPAPEAAEPEGQVDFSASIAVLNGTGTAGLAAERAGVLNGAGFAQTSAANADGWTTAVSTVFYEDPAFAATAKEVAKALGIANVEQASGIGGTNIAVVLK